MNIDELPMRIAIGQTNQLTPEIIQFAHQIGVQDIQFNTPRLPGESRWEYMDLLRLRTSCEDAGLRLNAIENVPGREEQIENMQATIRNLGKAGIPIFGYHWMPNSVWRTSTTARARGDAQTTAFDFEQVKNAPLSFDREYSAEEMWRNYEYYIKAVLPVAEEVGVKLALHPDDPPVPTLGGVARLMRNFEGFKRALEIGDSPNHGLDFCVGSWSEMSPEECLTGLRHFGQQGKIFYVHFRDVLGTVPTFREAFIGEGNLDNFKGFLIDDHVPRMVGDTGWVSLSRAFANGQMVTMLALLNESAT
jgi:mannonate dehydratase